MPGWDTMRNIAFQEIRQREQEGYETKGLIDALSVMDENENALESFYKSLNNLKKRTDYPYIEPDDYSAILAASSPINLSPMIADAAILKDAFYGAWLGRCIGCCLGKPFEVYPFVCGDGKQKGYEFIKNYLSGANAYPLTDYVPEKSDYTSAFSDVAANPYGMGSVKERINCAESDDDIRYTVLGLKILEKYGADFDSFDIGDVWIQNLCLSQVCTAETQAYQNFGLIRSHCNPKKPENFRQKIEYVRNHLNPYREYIGAQIRADGLAMGAAANPALAAKMCFEDATFSHCKNGVYGEIFVGVLISSAFAVKDVWQLVEIGMSYVPKRSRLYEALTKTIELVKICKNFEIVYQFLWKEFGHYDWVHTINNAALVTAALLLSNGDFEKGITYAVMGGFDTDCNGATVGSILGALNGSEKIPQKWKVPLHNTLYGELIGFHPISISECADRSFKVYQKLKTK